MCSSIKQSVCSFKAKSIFVWIIHGVEHLIKFSVTNRSHCIWCGFIQTIRWLLVKYVKVKYRYSILHSSNVVSNSIEIMQWHIHVALWLNHQLNCTVVHSKFMVQKSCKQIVQSNHQGDIGGVVRSRTFIQLAHTKWWQTSSNLVHSKVVVDLCNQIIKLVAENRESKWWQFLGNAKHSFIQTTWCSTIIQSGGKIIRIVQWHIQTVETISENCKAFIQTTWCGTLKPWWQIQRSNKWWQFLRIVEHSFIHSYKVVWYVWYIQTVVANSIKNSTVKRSNKVVAKDIWLKDKYKIFYTNIQINSHRKAFKVDCIQRPKTYTHTWSQYNLKQQIIPTLKHLL